MKYELETIPIWDAYDAESECPLCLLEEKAEKSYLEFFLGGSVMIPEMRIEVNRTGFCPQHFSLLFKEDNRHGLGLITHTHLKEIMGKIDRRHKRLAFRAGGGVPFMARLFSRGKKVSLKDALHNFITLIRKTEAKCMICDRIDYTLKRYTFTIVYLWQRDREFKEKFQESKGFCLHHLPHVIGMAEEIMGGRRLSQFVANLIPLQERSLTRLEEEIKWYTLKFAYENRDKPWGTSKDALHRTLQKLTGKIMKDK